MPQIAVYLKELFVELCPSILQGYGTVEDKVVCGRLLIYVEVTDTLELQIVVWFSISQVLLYVALCEHLE
jgi:hypothetical protein